MKKLALAATIALTASNAYCAGFRLAVQDAKANGMGNAFVAVADNASAVWYNPAAITGLEGTNMSLGTVIVAPTMEHKNEVGATSTDKIKDVTHILPNFYATHKLNDQWSLGLGINAPFGLSTEWSGTTANTRGTATRTKVKDINYNLNGAYKLNDKLSFGAGINYASIDAVMNRMHSPTSTTKVNLEGDGTAFGYNAAVMYKHDDKWNFGANFRSKMKSDLEGKMVVGATPTDVKTKLNLPDMFQIGASYRMNDKWLFSAEADYTNWTTYHSIIIKKKADNTIASTDVKNWKSVWAFRAGTEYKYSDTWKFRAGTFYDKNPVREHHFETRIPDSDRIALAVGTGYNKGNITVDVSYAYVKFMERKVTDSFAGDHTGSSTTDQRLNGKYNAYDHLPAITVGYKF